MQVKDLHLYLKCHSSTGVFKHFASKNQLSGLSRIGTLGENGLIRNFCTIFSVYVYLAEGLQPIQNEKQMSKCLNNYLLPWLQFEFQLSFECLVCGFTKLLMSFWTTLVSQGEHSLLMFVVSFFPSKFKYDIFSGDFQTSHANFFLIFLILLWLVLK